MWWAFPKGNASRCCKADNWKIRHAIAPDPDDLMPADLQQLVGYMRQRYAEAGGWWADPLDADTQTVAEPAARGPPP
jgi:hypothetical protein